MAARFMSVPFKFHGPWPRKRYKTNRFINKKKEKEKGKKQRKRNGDTRKGQAIFSNKFDFRFHFRSVLHSSSCHTRFGPFRRDLVEQLRARKKKSSFKAPTTTSPYIQSGQRIVYGINCAQRASLPLTNCASSETVRHGIRH